MAELLLRIRSKTSSDIYKDVRLTKRGDVIVVCPDGHQWGTQELTNPDWRIVRCPSITVAEAEALLVEEPGDPLINRMLQRRWFYYDLTKLSPQIQALLDPDSPRTDFEINRNTARNLKTQKSSIPDPNVIG